MCAACSGVRCMRRLHGRVHARAPRAAPARVHAERLGRAPRGLPLRLCPPLPECAGAPGGRRDRTERTRFVGAFFPLSLCELSALGSGLWASRRAPARAARPARVRPGGNGGNAEGGNTNTAGRNPLFAQKLAQELAGALLRSAPRWLCAGSALAGLARSATSCDPWVSFRVALRGSAWLSAWLCVALRGGSMVEYMNSAARSVTDGLLPTAYRTPAAHTYGLQARGGLRPPRAAWAVW